MRRLLSTTLLVAALPGLAAAQDKPTLLDLFDLDKILQSVLQSGVMALRTQMDLVYSDMAVDLFSGKVTITDVLAWPLPEWDLDGTCEISIDRVTARGGALDVVDEINLSFQILNASFPTSCLPPDVSEPISLVGISELTIPRMTLDVEYGVPASDGQFRLFADVSNVGVIDVAADFAYIWMDGRDDIEEPIPIMFLEHGIVSFEDDGLYANIAPLLPPPLTAEGSGLFIQGALGEELLNETRRAADDDSATLTPAQEAFLASLAQSWPAFIANPEMIVLETTMDGDVFLDLELIEDDPREIFDALQPIVSLAARARSEFLPAEMLQAAISGDSSALSADDRKRVGLALVRGEGVPRNLNAGGRLLGDIARAGDGHRDLAAGGCLSLGVGGRQCGGTRHDLDPGSDRKETALGAHIRAAIRCFGE